MSTQKLDTKAFKRSLSHSKNYHRKGFGHAEEVNTVLDAEYQSNLIQEIRNNSYRLSKGDVTIRLAEALAFVGEWNVLWPWPMKPASIFLQNVFGLLMKLFIIPQ